MEATAIESLRLKKTCPLCCAETSNKMGGRRDFCLCSICQLVFVSKDQHLSNAELRKRYLLHENSIEQSGYCDFLNRAILAAKPYLAAGAKGLDFGCGHTPTLSKLAEREGLHVSDFDPLFFNQPLHPPYDFIFATECFEHFEDPEKSIAWIVSLLRPGGILTVMTELWNAKTDFKNWYYTGDPSHIVFYSSQTLEYMCRQFKLKQIAGDGKRVFVFSKF